MARCEARAVFACALVGFVLCAFLVYVDYRLRHAAGWQSPSFAGAFVGSDAFLLGSFGSPFFVPTPMYGVGVFLWLANEARCASGKNAVGFPAVRILLAAFTTAIAAVLLNIAAVVDRAASVTSVALVIIPLAIALVSGGAVRRSGFDVLQALERDVRARERERSVLRTIALISGGLLVAFMFYTNGPGAVSPLCERLAAAVAHGTPKQPAEVVVYGDFQCDLCAHADRALARLKSTPTLRLVRRQDPRDAECNAKVHGAGKTRACAQARAAICAARFGRGDDYATQLFETQVTSESELVTLAATFGIARNEFARCIASPETESALLDDLRSASSDGVVGTPTFIIEGERLTGYDEPADKCIVGR